MNGRLLYHKTKGDGDHHGVVKTRVGNITAYSDDFSGNQDPYIWQKVFLHSYCHMGQMREGFNKPKEHPEVEREDISFWITSNARGDYSQLYCDLVFVVADKVYWPIPNHIDRHDLPARSDSAAAFEEHYAWVGEHCLKPKKIAKGYRRFTLKADPLKSFQPQDAKGNLLDIRPLLVELGIDLEALEKALGPKAKGSYSRPFLLDAQQTRDLYARVRDQANVRRTGADFERVRKLR